MLPPALSLPWGKNNESGRGGSTQANDSWLHSIHSILFKVFMVVIIVSTFHGFHGFTSFVISKVSWFS